MISIENYLDYKEFLKVTLRDLGPGAQGSLAQAAGCQQSYLSKAIHGSIHLTPEHADGIARFLGLDGPRYELFLAMVNFARSGTRGLRAFQEKKIDDLKKLVSEFKAQISAKPISNLTDRYYSAWYFSAIHILVSIPKYSTVEALAERLSLHKDLVKMVLLELQTHDLVESHAKHWKHKAGNVHADKGTLANQMHLSHWRARALESATEFSTENLHYTGIHSLSKKDLQEFILELRTLLVRFNRKVSDSPEEEGVALNVDFFTIK